ncbi:MAG: hypothetical protein ACE1Z6_03175, partial [Candidatus Methylomirabilales bacterium]
PVKEQAPLSPHWAFVVQFRVGTEVEQGQVTGRVEHIVSGQATHFQSVAPGPFSRFARVTGGSTRKGKAWKEKRTTQQRREIASENGFDIFLAPAYCYK